MADKLQDAKRLLRDRVAELDSERQQLTKALERLEGIETKRPSRTRSRGRRSSSGRSRSSASSKRAARGQREQQLITSIEADPSRRVSDHAREIGVRPQQLYPILNRLTKSDKLEKTGGLYKLKA
jgi:predicted Rossmann fold nucleotide-binding protein DprA/Smf involved in DNA uptake